MKLIKVNTLDRRTGEPLHETPMTYVAGGAVSFPSDEAVKAAADEFAKLWPGIAAAAPISTAEVGVKVARAAMEVDEPKIREEALGNAFLEVRRRSADEVHDIFERAIRADQNERIISFLSSLVPIEGVTYTAGDWIDEIEKEIKEGRL